METLVRKILKVLFHLLEKIINNGLQRPIKWGVYLQSQSYISYKESLASMNLPFRVFSSIIILVFWYNILIFLYQMSNINLIFDFLFINTKALELLVNYT